MPILEYMYILYYTIRTVERQKNNIRRRLPRGLQQVHVYNIIMPPAPLRRIAVGNFFFFTSFHSAYSYPVPVFCKLTIAGFPFHSVCIEV